MQLRIIREEKGNLVNKMLKELIIKEIKLNGFTKEFVEEQKISKLVEKKGKKYFIKPNIRKKVKVVLTGGVFDIIHLGHVKTLCKAKQYGDLLVVVVANDSFIKKKGREPIHSQKERVELVNSLKCVDLAIKGYKDPKRTVKRVKPHAIVYGYDQPVFLKPKGIKIIKLKKHYMPSRLKTGKIIKKLLY